MKILSIIPAQDGWFSLFEQKDGTISRYQVAIWAVIEDDGYQRVTGFSESGDGFADPDDEASNFMGFVKGNNDEGWTK